MKISFFGRSNSFNAVCASFNAALGRGVDRMRLSRRYTPRFTRPKCYVFVRSIDAWEAQVQSNNSAAKWTGIQ